MKMNDGRALVRAGQRLMDDVVCGNGNARLALPRPRAVQRDFQPCRFGDCHRYSLLLLFCRERAGLVALKKTLLAADYNESDCVPTHPARMPCEPCC